MTKLEIDLDLARTRIDRATLLLQRALDLREQLTWELDLEDMRSEVNAFTFAVQAYHWDRWQ